MTVTTNQERTPKRQIYDSVFCSIARKKEYLLQIFQALHPEDTTTTADDLQNVTLRNVLVDDLYNDLGFEANGRTLVLVEAQSQWSENIILRILLYYLRTLDDKVTQRHYNLFKRNAVAILKPEFYVVYTGDKKDVPDTISLTESFFHGQQADIEVTAKVIHKSGPDNILTQYIAFAKLYKEQVKLTGPTQETIETVLQQCLAQDILADFLDEHQNEVRQIMSALFDEEVILRNYVADECEQARSEGRDEGRAEGRKEGRAEGRKEGRAEGRKEGRNEGILSIVLHMLRKQLPFAQISELTGCSEPDVERIARENGFAAV